MNVILFKYIKSKLIKKVKVCVFYLHGCKIMLIKIQHINLNMSCFKCKLEIPRFDYLN